jgi:hypothetical protein
VVRVDRIWSDGGRRVEAGGSWAGGANLEERFTHAVGGDLTVEGYTADGALDYRWQSEYAMVSEDFKAGRDNTGGLSTHVQRRFARRWWAQARYDYYGLPSRSGAGWEDRATVLLAFVPNERAPLRIQYSRWRVDDLDRGFNQVHLQLNFTLGPHAAHRYGRRS